MKRDQILMTIAILLNSGIYLAGIFQKKIKPTLSTWIFLSFAIILSFFINFQKSGIGGIANNMYNLIDGIAVLCITLVTWFIYHDKITFNELEKKCSIFVVIIGIIGLFSHYQDITHILIQIVLCIAYVPMVVKYRGANKHTESILVRGITIFGSALGLVQPILNQDILPIIYNLRATICGSIVLLLLLRIEYKQKNQNH